MKNIYLFIAAFIVSCSPATQSNEDVVPDTYVQLLYFELITIFPIIDVVLKTVNPFYN